MIARHWQGIVKPGLAEEYIRYLRQATLPALHNIAGFMAAQILKREIARGTEFRIVTHWESFASIRAFAGESPERAVVPPEVQSMMVDFDREVRHYDIVFQLKEEGS